MKPIATLCLFTGVLLGQSKPVQLKVEPVFDLHLQLSGPVDVGQTGPAGLRRIVSILGGSLQGPGLKGKIMPGAD